MSRWTYGRDAVQRRPVKSGEPGVSPGPPPQDRGKEPSRRSEEPTPAGQRSRSPWPSPEPLDLHDVLPLKRADVPRHRGRRGDDRGRPRRTREQRVEHVLELVGTYRVLSRRSIVEQCFDGHPFAASRVLPALEHDGLIAVHKVRAGRKSYQVFSLSGPGRDLMAWNARRGRRKTDEDEELDAQRFWASPGDVRQLRHDHHVFDAVMQDTEDLREQGGRIRRVRLETELRGILAAAGETARQTEGDLGAERARREAAERIGLRVFAEAVPLPDALVEVEDADGRRSVRAIEVVTGAYTHTQVREKQRAGFRLYALAGVASERRSRRTAREVDVPFPLSWGRGR